MLQGLFILATFNVNAIRANPKAIDEYNRIRSESILITDNNSVDIYDNTLTVTLLNTRSFRTHAIDIGCRLSLVLCAIACQYAGTHVKHFASVKYHTRICVFSRFTKPFFTYLVKNIELKL